MNITSILATSEKVFDIPEGSILSHNRSKNITAARAVAMFLSRLNTNKSYPELGKEFKRDHSAVVYNCRKIRKMLEDDSDNYVILNMEKIALEFGLL